MHTIDQKKKKAAEATNVDVEAVHSTADAAAQPRRASASAGNGKGRRCGKRVRARAMRTSSWDKASVMHSR